MRVSGITKIADDTFSGCRSLTAAAVPKGVTSIGTGAFLDCTSLKDIYYAGSLEQWSKISVSENNSVLSDATIHENTPALSETPAPGESDFQYKTLDDGTIAVTWYAGADTQIEIPKEIDNKLVTAIDQGADNTKTIGNSAFSRCLGLTSVTIGKNTASIGNQAFKNCSKLDAIKINSTKLEQVGKNAFKGIRPTAKIKVPSKKLSAYKKLLKGKGQGANVTIRAI